MWQLELTELVRAIIFDLSDTPDYSDEDLLRVIVAAAHLVAKAGEFSQDFKVDISSQSITPDPSATSTKDEDFLNLVALRVACGLDIAKSRIQNANAVLVKDDRNTYDFRDTAKGFLELLKLGHCKVYETALLDYQMGRGGEYATIILSPFRTLAGGRGRIRFR